MAISVEDKILDIIKQTALHAYLATCDGDQSMVRPVSRIVEHCTCIRVATSATSRKSKLIPKNPRVSLAFAELPHGEKVATVIGEAVGVDRNNPQRARSIRFHPWQPGMRARMYLANKTHLAYI